MRSLERRLHERSKFFATYKLEDNKRSNSSFDELLNFMFLFNTLVLFNHIVRGGLRWLCPRTQSQEMFEAYFGDFE